MQVRLLAPWTDSKGNPHAPGAVVDVSDEEAQHLLNSGKGSDEAAAQDALKKAETEGSYGDRTSRDKAGGTVAPADKAPPPPTAEKK